MLKADLDTDGEKGVDNPRTTMALTDIMDDVDYNYKNFNDDEVLHRHPLWLTESHFIYNLLRDSHGRLFCKKNINGDVICSPRHLNLLCMKKLVTNPMRMQKFKFNEVPFDLYPALLTEAIFQRELQTITYLVSTWPQKVLDIQSTLPLEDVLPQNYLTMPVEGQGSTSLVDSFMLGLLTLKPHAKLKLINFNGFKNDRKLCRELSRLPILWLTPADRQVGYVHSLLRKTLGISRDKVQRYLNRIACIYSLIDPCIRHGNKIGPVTIVLDCKVTLDDVPIGLVLQHVTPFRFVCKRLWTEPIAEVTLPTKLIPTVLDPRYISHLEVTDENLCSNLNKFDDLLEALLLMSNIEALSLPNTVHVNVHTNAAYELNQVLQQLHGLRKLNFWSSNLRDNLDLLLNDLDLPVIYLNLRDCRLSKSDMEFLLQWGPLSGLRELNLSRNNLKNVVYLAVSLIQRLPQIICYSMSYCCFSVVGIKQIVRKCLDCPNLKILGIQPFTPAPIDDIKMILEDCANIPSLQRLLLLPEAYAFPGNNELSRFQNRELLIRTCTEFLDALERPDIEFE